MEGVQVFMENLSPAHTITFCTELGFVVRNVKVLEMIQLVSIKILNPTKNDLFLSTIL